MLQWSLYPLILAIKDIIEQVTNAWYKIGKQKSEAEANERLMLLNSENKCSEEWGIHSTEAGWHDVNLGLSKLQQKQFRNRSVVQNRPGEVESRQTPLTALKDIT